MRFSGSIYDILRQPGVFGELARQTAGTWNAQSHMKEAVLARLRLDDLLSNDDLSSDESSKPRVVASISDIIDGRLFTLLSPQDLEGIDLEIICPQRVKDEPASAVLQTVRSWIQNQDGTGRPAFFMACSGGSTRVDIAKALQSMSGLDVNSLQQARMILESAGMERPIANELEAYWYDWQEAIARHDHRLSPYPARAASAVLNLRRCLEGLKRQPEGFGLTETGVNAFTEGLRVLEDNHGRRDATTALFEQYIAKSSGTDRDEVTAVKQIFYHHMFEAITAANKARPEHSVSIGSEDTTALPEAYLMRLERFEDSLERIHLDTRIVVALGGMTTADYKETKRATVSRIAIGIREFKRTANERGGRGDLSELNKALDALAQKCRSAEGFSPSGIGTFFRRYVVAPGLAGAATAAFGILFGSSSTLEAAREAGATAAAVGIVRAVWDNMPGAAMVHHLLFRRSLVKAAQREL